MRNVLLTVALALLAVPALAQSNSACGNGDFEPGRDLQQWSGGHGFVLRNGEPHFSSFTPGLVDGPLEEASSHQTIVDDRELDPVVGIRRVAPGGSTRAVRIGNSFCDAHADMLAKTFVVDAAQSLIRFSYAVVLQQGGHSSGAPSSFRVRVLDASGNPIAGVVDLAGGRDELVAGDRLVLQVSGDVYYRDWTRGTIDLSRHAGRTVTVQFITEDCSTGGHYAYAYVDDFCGTGCGGTLDLVAPTLECGPGEVCVRYALPEVADVTGNVVLKLDLLQDETVVASISSPPQTTGTAYCFPIDPKALLPFPDRAFTFVVIGTFSIGDSVCEVKIVRAPGEYRRDCRTCDTGFNEIADGDFEKPAEAPAMVLPGQSAVLNAAEAAAIAATWQARSHSACDVDGQFLLVNGATGRSGSRVVWSQEVPVIAGRHYRFSANFRNLPICSFDVTPEVTLRLSASTDAAVPFAIHTGVSDPCHWQQESRTIHIPAGVTLLTCEIWLDETGNGDGNDLAIDDIALCLLKQ
jgi:hypothetical protein